MQNPSRRAFLGGRAPQISLWEQFLLQVQRKTQGSLRRLDQGEEQAVFTPLILADLHHVRQLCHAFGIKLYLWGSREQSDDEVDAILWLDCSGLAQLAPVDAEQNQWFMQAGVSMAQLKEAGFDALASLPDDLLVANWLAEARYQYRPLSRIAESGLVHASLLMSDGTVSSLGAFGAQNTKPLNTALLRQIVPQLFQLATTELAQPVLALPDWIGAYRWDILQADNTALNLSHLLLGHGGDLGVVEWVVLDKQLLRAAEPLKALPEDPALCIAAQELDGAVKQLFDPDQLFS